MHVIHVYTDSEPGKDSYEPWSKLLIRDYVGIILGSS